MNQELTQKGTAYVYNVNGNLIDEKNFRVVEIAHGEVSYLADWYHVTSFDYIKQWNYHWIIPGVYHFVGRRKRLRKRRFLGQYSL